MTAFQCRTLMAFLVTLTLIVRAQAGTVWDGDGGATATWTTAANWDADTLPAFDGTDNITIITLNAAGTATDLNGDKNINSLTTTPNLDYSISNNTLTLQSGNITGSSTSRNVTIHSNITLGMSGTFDIGGGGAGILTVNGNIGQASAGLSLTKAGARRVNLNGTNTYTGQTIHNGGQLWVGGNVAVSTAGPLGNAASAVVLGQASGNNVTLVLPNANQSFARNIEVSSGGTGTVRIDSYGGAAAFTTISGNILLNKDLTIYGNHSNTGYVEVTGIISGSGGLNLHRNVLLSQAHTYTGTTTIGEHPNFFTMVGADAPNGAPGAFGNATSDVILQSSGLFITGGHTIGRNLSITGNVGLSQTGAGAGTFNGNIDMPNATTTTLSITNASGTQVFNGIISGQGGFLRNGGAGFDTFFNNPNNSFTGTVEIRIGDIIVGADAPSGSNGALGNSTSAILFGQLNSSHDSSLLINGAFEVGRDINIANSGTGDDTTLGGMTADNSTFSGNISINAQSNALLTAAAGGQTTFSGVISGAGDVRKVDSGSVVLSGNNTYLGTTTVSTGTLIAAANDAFGDTGTGTTVSSGASLGFQGDVDYTSTEAVSVTGTGVSSSGAIKNISGNNSFAGPITLTGNTTLGADAGQLELTGLITDGAGTFNITKQGAGTVSLANPTGNTYSGTTTILNGTLLANNTSGSATSSGPVFIGAGGSLGGTGIIDGNVSALAGGSITPGNSAGNLTLGGNLDFADNTSQFVVELADSGSDRLTVNGTVDLSDATLSGSVFGSISVDSKIFILVNDDADAITGTFDGLANGAIVDLGMFIGQNASAQISYFGNFGTGSLTGGNDIVLYNFVGTQVPEPSSFLLLGLGVIGLRRVRRRR